MIVVAVLCALFGCFVGLILCARNPPHPDSVVYDWWDDARKRRIYRLATRRAKHLQRARDLEFEIDKWDLALRRNTSTQIAAPAQTEDR